MKSTFWRGCRVLLTGHTGFKGGWAAVWLDELGAKVTGLALAPEGEPNLFTEAGIERVLDHRVVDLRDATGVTALVHEVQPEIVLHLAAQPLVLRSYAQPQETFAANAMGTVHLLEALREVEPLRVVLTVTSDKVYADDGAGHAHTENSRLGGRDPYSASKAMTEIAVSSYARSFFDSRGVRAATARGGNVIGGGDFAQDRILPDAWRATRSGQPLVLRNPHAVRPWQHVLDCLSGYLRYVELLAADAKAPRALNFGPDEGKVDVATLAQAFFSALGKENEFRVEPQPCKIETDQLVLDTSLAKSVLPWKPRYSATEAVALAAEWHRRVDAGEDALAVTREQIRARAAS